MKTLLGEKGFTLIEMLLVLTLIAAIVGIALPSFRSMQQEGNMTRAQGDLRTLQTATESYYIHNDNTYPTALSDLTSATPTVVRSLPSDPFSGSDYEYAVDGDDVYYIRSVGVDGTGDVTASASGVTVPADSDDVWVSNMEAAS